jgi:thioredoxin 1
MSTIKITDATFENETKTGVCIIDFYADWCGPCKAIAPVLEKLSKEFEGKIKIFKLNVDENQVTASEFGIRSIPTLVAFKDGKKIEVKVGGMPEAQLKTWINSLL